MAILNMGALTQLAGITTGLRAGLPAPHILAQLAGASQEPLIQRVLDHVPSTGASAVSGEVGRGDLLNAFERAVEELNASEGEENPAAQMMLSKIGEDLRLTRTLEAPDLRIPSVFRPHMERIGRELSHTLNNRHAIVVTNADLVHEGLQDVEKILRSCLSSEGLNPETRDSLERGLLIASDLTECLADSRTSIKMASDFIARIRAVLAASEGSDLAVMDLFSADPRPAAPPTAATPVALPSRGTLSIEAPILMVEDEEDVGSLFEDILKARGFSSVHRARSPEEALRFLEENPDIRVVLTDYRMPGEMNGVGLARELRKRKPNLEIIFLSGNVPDIQEELSRDEEDSFVLISKPVETDQLVQSILALLNIPFPK